MPTIITHGVVAYLAARMAGPSLPPRLWGLSMLCAMVPDLDSIGLYLGVPYGHILGHRGFSHSPLFALVLAIGVCLVGLRSISPRSRTWWWCLAILTLSTASHGLLDAVTTAPYGVAFLVPFSDERILLPWLLVPAVAVGWDFFTRPVSSAFVTMAEIQVFWMPLLLILHFARES